MVAPISHIPDGYHSVTPYLLISGASEAIEFYIRVLDAVELMRLTDPDGRIAHAELRIGNSHLMVADERPDMDLGSPSRLGGCPMSLMIYVPDADTVFSRALSAGATELRPMNDQFYGDRSGSFTDPWGYHWTISTRIEIISREEMTRRFNSFLGLDESDEDA